MPGWYDLFSTFYDAALEELYAPFRAEAMKRLQLAPGHHVLDVGCGTGQSFDGLAEGVGSEGRVVGVDRSPGMLKVARQRIEARGLDAVRLVEAALPGWDAAAVRAHLLGRPGFDRALFFLLLSALEDGARAFDEVWSLLAPGARVLVVDVHAERLGIQGRLVNLTARADIRRECWRPLEAACEGFELERLEAPAQLGGDIVMATGAKPA